MSATQTVGSAPEIHAVPVDLVTDDAARRLADVLVTLAMLYHQGRNHEEAYGAARYLECPDHACRNVRAQLRSVGLDPGGCNTPA